MINRAAELVGNTSVSSNISILLVEDSEDDYIITSRLLSQVFDADSLNLIWEKTYDGALDAVHAFNFNVLLIDVNLGGSNGLSLTENLNPHNDDTPPIIILTGGESIELELRAIRLGASDCIFKNQLTAALLERVISYSIARKQTEKKLRENETRYRAILETASDAIITLSDEGMITSYNPATEKLFGYAKREIIGKNIMVLMPKNIGSKHDGYLAEYLSTKIERIIGRGREVVGMRKDGTEFPLYLSVADVGISGAFRFSGILRDLTLEKKAEESIKLHNTRLEKEVLLRTEELQAAKEKAERADNVKSEFLANISHEIRTPLYGILSFASMGVDRALDGPTEKSQEYFSHIKESGDRLLTLLNDLLSLSKLEHNKRNMPFKNEDIKTIIDQCFQSEQVRLQEKNIKWKIINHLSSTTVQCNNDGMRGVIENLLSNAIRFSSVGGDIDVDLSYASEDKSFIKICFTDEGVGVPEDELESIFEKFIQSSKTNTGAGGTGLGLSICKEIIKIHKGEIWAENRIGNGSHFIIEIPVRHNEVLIK